jgi:hypothetical protein
MSQQKADVVDDEVFENLSKRKQLTRAPSTTLLPPSSEADKELPPPSPRIQESPDRSPQQPLSPTRSSSKVDSKGNVIHVCRICEESFPEVNILYGYVLCLTFLLLQNLLREHDLLCAIVNKIDAKHLSCDERLGALGVSIKRAIAKSSRNSVLLELGQIAKEYVFQFPQGGSKFDV